jgi:hypothetical protein
MASIGRDSKCARPPGGRQCRKGVKRGKEVMSGRRERVDRMKMKGGRFRWEQELRHASEGRALRRFVRELRCEPESKSRRLRVDAVATPRLPTPAVSIVPYLLLRSQLAHLLASAP